MIRAWKDIRPQVGVCAGVDVSPQVEGDVNLGEGARVCRNTVVGAKGECRQMEGER